VARGIDVAAGHSFAGGENDVVSKLATSPFSRRSFAINLENVFERYIFVSVRVKRDALMSKRDGQW
jgi:hypothetical protein